MHFVTYETGGIYTAAAARLLATWHAWRGQAAATFESVVLPDRGSWWANVAHKPMMLATSYRQGKRPLIYLDADCLISSPLSSFEELLKSEADVLVRHRPPEWPVRHNCGVLVLQPHHPQRVQDFLDHWSILVQRYGRRHATCDQPLFAESARKAGIILGDLPASFNAQSSDVGLPDEEIVVRHYKTSRRSPELAAWKEAREIELCGVRRMASYVKTKVEKPLLLVWPEVEPRPDETASLVGIDHIPGGNHPAPTIDSAWFSRGRIFSIAAVFPMRRIPYMCATETSDGDTAALIQARLPARKAALSPSDINHLLAQAHLFYPNTSGKFHSDFAEGELTGSEVWVAALQALAFRGARRVRCLAPQTFDRQPVECWAKALEITCTWE